MEVGLGTRRRASRLCPCKTEKPKSRSLILIDPTWTSKVCKITAFRAIIMGLALAFYILVGLR